MRASEAFVTALCLLILAIIGVHALVSVTLGNSSNGSGQVAGILVRATSTPVRATPTIAPIQEPATARAHPSRAQSKRRNHRRALPQRVVAPHPTPTPSFIAVSGGLPVPVSPVSGLGGGVPSVASGYTVSTGFAPASTAIRLDRYWISPRSVRPGRRVTIWYTISNDTGMTVRLMLGASIKPNRVPNWMMAGIVDWADDVVATVPPGTSTHMRTFLAPANLRPGWYDVAWGLRGAITHMRLALNGKAAALRILG